MKNIVITGINVTIYSELNKKFIDKGYYYVIGIDRTDPRQKDTGQFEYIK